MKTRPLVHLALRAQTHSGAALSTQSPAYRGLPRPIKRRFFLQSRTQMQFGNHSTFPSFGAKTKAGPQSLVTKLDLNQKPFPAKSCILPAARQEESHPWPFFGRRRSSGLFNSCSPILVCSALSRVPAPNPENLPTFHTPNPTLKESGSRRKSFWKNQAV